MSQPSSAPPESDGPSSDPGLAPARQTEAETALLAEAADVPAQRRPGTRRLYLSLGLLFLVLAGSYYLLQHGNLQPAHLNNRVLLFALWYLNILLILAVLYVLVRSLFRVLLDRRNRILGSKFQTKLVLSAFALSLVPVLILVPFATRLVIESFDQWMELPVEDLVQEGAELVQGLQTQIETTGLRDASRVLREIEGFDLDDVAEQPRLLSVLQLLREEMGLHYLLLYEGQEFVHATADPALAGGRLPSPRHFNRFLEETLAAGQATRVEQDSGFEGHLILCARAADGSDDNKRPVVVVGTLLAPELADKVERLTARRQNYLRLRVAMDQIRGVSLLILLLVTLLVMLAFSAIGMRLARRITEPIQALAAAMGRIRSGELEHRMAVPVDEELAVLVADFNRMAAELERNKQLAERSSRRLEQAKGRLGAVLANLAAGVVAIDGSGRVLTCNAAALQILHQGEDEVLGKPVEEVWGDPGRRNLLEVLQPSSGEAARHWRTEVRVVVGETVKTLDVKVRKLPAADHEPGGRVIVLEDLSELIHAQKMATWNEVARRIAHEIKNPLTPIRLAAERLLRKHQQGSEDFARTLESSVDLIVQEVSSLQGMVDEFSRFARMPRPRPAEVELQELLDRVLPLYQGLRSGVQVVSELRPEASTVWFDPEQLRSVLVNLLDNALEATEAPGRVSVSSALEDGAVLITVADSGRGIPAEDRAKLFLPYFSTKGRGSGLGLSIVHRILGDHNASIRVSDNQPQGTAFVMVIPRL